MWFFAYLIVVEKKGDRGILPVWQYTVTSCCNKTDQKEVFIFSDWGNIGCSVGSGKLASDYSRVFLLRFWQVKGKRTPCA
jgi:hypothetical protein